TVAVRALATHELSSANAARIILREILVGLVNGLAFAVMICNLLAGARVRNHGDGCRRILFVPRHRHAVVRAPMTEVPVARRPCQSDAPRSAAWSQGQWLSIHRPTRPKAHQPVNNFRSR